MNLFLFRHAEAEDTYPDETRVLTPKGEKSINKLCAALDAKEFGGISSIQHSTLTRAKQTAACFKESLAIPQPLVERNGLSPSDNPLLLLPELTKADDDILLVGHNPHLSILADTLMLQSTSEGLIHFKKCGLLCLQRVCPPSTGLPYGSWVLAWFMIPRIVN